MTGQATSAESARNKAKVGKLSGVGCGGVLAVTSESYSRQSDEKGNVSGGRMASQRIKTTSC